jgi:hypothetical protein
MRTRTKVNASRKLCSRSEREGDRRADEERQAHEVDGIANEPRPVPNQPPGQAIDGAACGRATGGRHGAGVPEGAVPKGSARARQGESGAPIPAFIRRGRPSGRRGDGGQAAVVGRRGVAPALHIASTNTTTPMMRSFQNACPVLASQNALMNSHTPIAALIQLRNASR